MIQTRSLLPGITLHCCKDTRFKHGCLTVQMVRPMRREESAYNALLSSVLLRASTPHPNLRAITEHLDTLYGAAVSPLVRRIGDYQTVGLYLSFMDERFALPGDEVLAPMIAFLEELLLDPLTKDGVFVPEIVESEKKNLIATIESERNDKRAYAMGKLLKQMCANDSFGLPRLGEADSVACIDSTSLFAHYRRILRESPITVFYVGSADCDSIAALLMPLSSRLGARRDDLPPQTALKTGQPGDTVESLDVTQGKLCMGFTTPITNRDAEFPAMQLLNTILGAGMTSKLFLNVREKLSLCYSIGSTYYGTKGVVTVAAGIDFDKYGRTRDEILAQLDACKRGEISDSELAAAKAAVASSLLATHDSPGSIEGYYATGALSGMHMTPMQYREAIERVTHEQVVAAAKDLTLHSTYFLKGVNE